MTTNPMHQLSQSDDPVETVIDETGYVVDPFEVPQYAEPDHQTGSPILDEDQYVLDATSQASAAYAPASGAKNYEQATPHSTSHYGDLDVGRKVYGDTTSRHTLFKTQRRKPEDGASSSAENWNTDCGALGGQHG